MRNAHRVPIIIPAPVDHADAVAVLRRYYAEMAARYFGRDATADEVDAALAEDAGSGFTPPTGVFLLARDRGGVAGCVGVRCVDPESARITRLYVQAGARGRGAGTALLTAAEQAARDLGARRVRLDTRRDLVGDRTFYVRNGYTETAPYDDGVYTDHGFAKEL